MTDLYTNPRPSWEEVMKPLGDSVWWPKIRHAASDLIVERMHGMGDYDSGISGSDINHTIFGIAQVVYVSKFGRDGSSEFYPYVVLNWIIDELRGYLPSYDDRYRDTP